MTVLNFLILSVGFVDISNGGDGWVSLNKEVKKAWAAEFDDSTVWPLFYKDLGAEKFSVRLPNHPSYRQAGVGRFEIQSEKGDEVLELIAFSKERGGRGVPNDSISPFEGGWVLEHVVLTEHYKYVLRTYTSDAESPIHTKFIRSFFVH